MKKNKHQDLVLLGLTIRKIRKAQGFSQEGLALEAEIDRSYLGGLERGERNVSFLTLVLIAKCLKLKVSKITKGIPNE